MKIIVTIGWFLIFLWLLRYFTSDEEYYYLLITFGVVALIPIIFVFIPFIIRTIMQIPKIPELHKLNTEKQKEYIKHKSIPYRKYLARKRTQLITVDDYGDIDDSKWKKELVYFYETKIGEIPEELARPIDDKQISWEEIEEIIDSIAINGEVEHINNLEFNDDMDGVEFEHYCAELIRQSGWSAKVSKSSNDQGVDIIAEKDNKILVLQCKKYTSPVGNKAVQEIIAGKSYYKAEYAAVVANSKYTQSAKQLAKSSRVLLLHHNDLPKIDEFISEI